MKANKTRLFLFLVYPILLLTACSTSPRFDTKEVDKSITPRSSVEEPAFALGKKVLWGGVILSTRNLKNSTQIEVLAYPLDSYQSPKTDQTPLGRFIVQHPGYLEPTSYSQGRLITLTGSISKIETGKVGDAEYQYPVIQSDQLHLWSTNGDRAKTSFHFGIGIGL